jgi:hypothetical protein
MNDHSASQEYHQLLTTVWWGKLSNISMHKIKKYLFGYGAQKYWEKIV